jgi:hypothetical protein
VEPVEWYRQLCIRDRTRKADQKEEGTGGKMIQVDPKVKEFADKFLKAPRGDSPEQIAARIRHWVDVANHPEAFVAGDTSPYAISAKRRSARQNLRRLLQKHPHIAEALLQDSEAVQ